MKKTITGIQANKIMGFDVFFDDSKVSLEELKNGQYRINGCYRLSEKQKDVMKEMKIFA